MTAERQQHPDFPHPTEPTLFLRDDPRSRPQRALAIAGQLAALVRLPPRSAWFYVRALRLAWRTNDASSPLRSARPVELLPLLRAARGARNVVEIGTGHAWTAIALVLANRSRRVTTLDKYDLREREPYLALMRPADRDRLTLITRPGEDGPVNERDVDFLFIDSSHRLEETKVTFRTWGERMRPGGTIAFHDYRNPHFPEVEQAIDEMGLEGDVRGQLFLWRRPADPGS